ncbi:hypothetical protein CFP66_17645 [Pseudonocardia sp. MH-G8]|nr:hypothetical protein CFP66_17645 [Pseudonocardia sp. MH-G8]
MRIGSTSGLACTVETSRYDREIVMVVKSLPSRHRRFDVQAKVWRVDVALIGPLIAELNARGIRVIDERGAA